MLSSFLPSLGQAGLFSPLLFLSLLLSKWWRVVSVSLLSLSFLVIETVYQMRKKVSKANAEFAWTIDGFPRWSSCDRPLNLRDKLPEEKHNREKQSDQGRSCDYLCMCVAVIAQQVKSQSKVEIYTGCTFFFSLPVYWEPNGTSAFTDPPTNRRQAHIDSCSTPGCS